MAKQIFINLAVLNLQKSTDFYTALGFEINTSFSDDLGRCMVWNEHIVLMILSHHKFKSFTAKPIANTISNIAAIFSLSMETKEAVNRFIDNGIKAGGSEPNEARVYDFMYQRTLEDPDGHTWEAFFMDLTKTTRAHS